MANTSSHSYPRFYPLGKGSHGLKGTTRGEMVPDSAFVKLKSPSPRKYGLVDGIRSLWQYVSGSSDFSTADMEKRNGRCSRILHQLPLDLVLQILGHLPEADLLALRASSRTFRSLLPRTINAKASDRVDFYTRRHRDRYVRGCKAEQDGYLDAQHLMCSACQASHPISHFLPTERLQPPTQRRCANAHRRIRICPHQTMDRLGLISAAAAFQVIRCCDMILATRNADGYPVLRVYRSYFSIHVDTGTPVDPASVTEAFSAVKEPVCPHLSTADLTYRYRDCPTSHLHHVMRQQCNAWCNLVKRCPISDEGCETFGLFQRTPVAGKGFDVLQLRSARVLDDVFDLEGERWVIQATEERTKGVTGVEEESFI